jgi:hypothetical protein
MGDAGVMSWWSLWTSGRSWDWCDFASVAFGLGGASRSRVGVAAVVSSGSSSSESSISVVAVAVGSEEAVAF